MDVNLKNKVAVIIEISGGFLYKILKMPGLKINGLILKSPQKA